MTSQCIGELAVAVIEVVFPISAILTPGPWTLFVSQGFSLLVWAGQSSIHSTIMAGQAPTEARATSVGIWTSVARGVQVPENVGAGYSATSYESF